MLNLNHPHGFLTLAGRKARFLGHLKSVWGPAKMVFAITQDDGSENLQKVLYDGCVTTEKTHENDIREAAAPSVKRTFWLNVYPYPAAAACHNSEHDAQLWRIAGSVTIPVTVDVPAT